MLTKVCIRAECLVSFTTNDNRKVYCSKSCAAIVNNSKYPKRIRSGETNCRFCNKLLIESQLGYCSRACNRFHKREVYINAWKSGENNGSQSSGALSTTVRKYLLEQAGHACTQCGWAEVNPKLTKPILTVDHIDGNWKNNSVDNLRVLCYNCHTLTPTFNALNIGNGQGTRGSGNRVYKAI